MGDFLGGPVVKNLPFSTGDVGSIPGWGTKILHVTGQLMEEKLSVKRKQRKQKHVHRLSWKDVLEALEYGK